MKNAMKMVLIVAAVIGFTGCKDKVPATEAAASTGDAWMNAQYGPECNWLDKNHKPLVKGGCTKEQWAEWNKTH